jgi:hypothetical protein
MRPEITTLVLPELPWIGARNGCAMPWFALPRLVPAPVVAGCLVQIFDQE